MSETLKNKTSQPIQESAPLLRGLYEKNIMISDQQISEYLDLGISQVTNLRNKILNSKGHFRMGVHSLYTMNSKEEVDLHQEIYAHFYKSIKQSIDREGSAPFLCFESNGQIDEVLYMVSEKLGSKYLDSSLIFPTFSDCGLPLFDLKDFIDRNNAKAYYQLVDRQFSILGNILFSLGVQSISMSGMRIFIFYHDDLGGYIADGCLGQFYNQLTKRGFLIGLSTYIQGCNRDRMSRYEVFTDLAKVNGYSKNFGKNKQF
jgi:hypothetical protein